MTLTSAKYVVMLSDLIQRWNKETTLYLVMTNTNLHTSKISCCIHSVLRMICLNDHWQYLYEIIFFEIWNGFFSIFSRGRDGRIWCWCVHWVSSSSSCTRYGNDEYAYHIPNPYTTLVQLGKGMGTQAKQHISWAASQSYTATVAVL